MKLLNQLVAQILPIVPKAIVRKVSSRYIAGSTLDDAVRTVRDLNKTGAMATVDVLGEYIKSMEEAAENTRYSCEVIERLVSEKIEGNLSVKLTSLGLGVDDPVCEQNVLQILKVAKQNGNLFVRFDMENSPYTTRTINLYRKFRGEYNVGVVLQAYLRRTMEDIDLLLSEGPTNVRLCKGIYIESPQIAYTDRKDIQENFLRCLDRLLSKGAYVGIATHDDYLIAGARESVRRHKRARDSYEFQMLLGVRDQARAALIREKHRVRVYVPFGADWYGYSIRRLKENPGIAGHIMKAMFTSR